MTGLSHTIKAAKNPAGSTAGEDRILRSLRNDREGKNVRDPDRRDHESGKRGASEGELPDGSRSHGGTSGVPGEGSFPAQQRSAGAYYSEQQDRSKGTGRNLPGYRHGDRFAELGQEVHIVGGGFRDAGRSWWRYASEARWTRRRSWQSWRPTLRPIGSQNADKQYQRLERMALERLNGLGIGAGELGGNTTALAMNIKWYPTHIVGMPVAVNVCCNVAHHCIAPLRDQVSGSACVFCVP